MRIKPVAALLAAGLGLSLLPGMAAAEDKRNEAPKIRLEGASDKSVKSERFRGSSDNVRRYTNGPDRHGVDADIRIRVGDRDRRRYRDDYRRGRHWDRRYDRRYNDYWGWNGSLFWSNWDYWDRYDNYYWRSDYGHRYRRGLRSELIVTRDGYIKRLWIRRGRVVDVDIVGRVRNDRRRGRDYGWYDDDRRWDDRRRDRRRDRWDDRDDRRDRDYYPYRSNSAAGDYGDGPEVRFQSDNGEILGRVIKDPAMRREALGDDGVSIDDRLDGRDYQVPRRETPAQGNSSGKVKGRVVYD